MTFGVRHRNAGVGFQPAPATILDLAAAPEGGGSRWSVPQAIHHGDETLICQIRGTDGRENIIRYVHSTQTPSVIALHGNFERDDHSNAAILPLASGGYVVFYPKHNNTPFNRRILPDVTNSAGWSSVLNLDSQLGGSRYTYPQAHQLLAETNDPVHLFFRDEPSAGTDSRWCHSVSTDDAVSFSAQEIIYRVAGARSYMTSWNDGQDRIHFAVTSSGSTIGGTGFTSIGHFYYDAGVWRTSAGVDMGSPPFDFSDVTPIKTGLTSFFPSHIFIDGSGFPVVSAFHEDVSGIWHYWYCRYDGASWLTTEVATGDTGHAYSSPTSRSPYGCTLDDGDVNVMYAIIEIGGVPELWRYETNDGGATFSSRYITRFSSSAVQREPFPVRYRDADLRVVWQAGTFTSSTNWNMAVKGTAT